MTDPGQVFLASIVEQARVILRMAPTDPDVARLTALAPAVVELVDKFIDTQEPILTRDTVPHSIEQACVGTLVEAYRRKDAPFGIVGQWTPDGVGVRVSNDWLAAQYPQLQPWREQFGVA